MLRVPPVLAGSTALERSAGVSQILLLLMLLLLLLSHNTIANTMPCLPTVLGCAALLVSMARHSSPLGNNWSTCRQQE